MNLIKEKIYTAKLLIDYINFNEKRNKKVTNKKAALRLKCFIKFMEQPQRRKEQIITKSGKNNAIQKHLKCDADGEQTKPSLALFISLIDRIVCCIIQRQFIFA